MLATNTVVTANAGCGSPGPVCNVAHEFRPRISADDTKTSGEALIVRDLQRLILGVADSSPVRGYRLPFREWEQQLPVLNLLLRQRTRRDDSVERVINELQKLVSKAGIARRKHVHTGRTPASGPREVSAFIADVRHLDHHVSRDA